MEEALFILTARYGEEQEQEIAYFGTFLKAWNEMNEIPVEDFAGYETVLSLYVMPYGFRHVQGKLFESADFVTERVFADENHISEP